MDTMKRKTPRCRPRRAFTEEFRADIVERCLKADRPINQVAKDFDLTVSAARAGSNRPRLKCAAPAQAPPTMTLGAVKPSVLGEHRSGDLG
jgi:transposase